MKLRVGLIGLGKAWETRHRTALRALSDRLEVRAVCEPVARRAALVAEEFQAAQVDGFRALAGREDVDAILLLSAYWYGALPILSACDAGKAVYCAAALDLESEQAHRVKQRVEESGIAFVAEFPLRQAPATLRLKELIATHLGPPRLIFCHQRQPARDPDGTPRGSPMRELIETVDWCRYLVDADPTSVVAMAHAGASGGSDYQMMSLDFSPPGTFGQGPVAQISCGRYLPADWQEALVFRPPADLQVVCERGVAFIDLPTSVTWFDDAGRHRESLESDRPVGEQLLLNFYRSVTSLVRNPSGLQDAYQSQHIVLQAQVSFKQGCRIDLAKP